MEEFFAFFTIDVWTLIMTWGNLLILFLLMKKFLFGPVKKIMDQRQEEIDKSIADADKANKEASALKEEYLKKLSDAKKEADEIISSATKSAQLKREEIVRDASKKATDILEKADKKIEQERQNALSELKSEVAQMSTAIASKIIEKDINEKDHEKLIEDFINEIGDAS